MFLFYINNKNNLIVLQYVYIHAFVYDFTIFI